MGKIIDRIIAWLAKELGWDVPSTDNLTEIPLEAPTKPVEKSNREKLYDVAYSCLGKDMAPLNDTLGCAEALSHVLLKAGVPDLHKPYLSSYELDRWLRTHFKEVLEPLPGDIISSPTGTGNGLIRGHVGIVGKQSIMSNNSLSGKWDYHWTMQKWLDYYEKYGKIPTKFYRWM